MIRSVRRISFMFQFVLFSFLVAKFPAGRKVAEQAS